MIKYNPYELLDLPPDLRELLENSENGRLYDLLQNVEDQYRNSESSIPEDPSQIASIKNDLYRIERRCNDILMDKYYYGEHEINKISIEESIVSLFMDMADLVRDVRVAENQGKSPLFRCRSHYRSCSKSVECYGSALDSFRRIDCMLGFFRNHFREGLCKCKHPVSFYQCMWFKRVISGYTNQKRFIISKEGINKFCTKVLQSVACISSDCYRNFPLRK